VNEYQISKTVTYTLVVTAKTPQEATIIAGSYGLDNWAAYEYNLDVESLGPHNEEIDEY
jgi:hypothetical protein